MPASLPASTTIRHADCRYMVNNDGVLTITMLSDIIIEGHLGALANGVAHSFVYGAASASE